MLSNYFFLRHKCTQPHCVLVAMFLGTCLLESDVKVSVPTYHFTVKESVELSNVVYLLKYYAVKFNLAVVMFMP